MNFSSQVYEEYRSGLVANYTYDLVFNSNAKICDNELGKLGTSTSEVIEREWDGRPFNSSIIAISYTTLISQLNNPFKFYTEKQHILLEYAAFLCNQEHKCCDLQLLYYTSESSPSGNDTP